MSENTTTGPTPIAVKDPNLMTLEEARGLLRVSRWALGQLISKGDLATYRVGRRRFVSAKDFEELLSRLREERPRGY